jgi:hypothetical protein
MQNLYYNITAEQELYWDAPEGRPSSVTSVTVYASEAGDDGTTEAATTGTAAVETNPDTTFDAASGVDQSDPRICNLAATTGIAVGRSYLATSATGESEWVEVRAITSAASVQARHNLVNAYANADTFESTRISISIDDTWIADENNISDDLNPNPGYRVRWVYVVGGIKRVHDSYLNVVRYRADHDVTPQEVDLVRSGWIHDLPSEHAEDQGAALIDDAYQEVVFDLHAIDVPAEMLRNRSVVNRLTIRKAIMMASENKAAATGNTTAYELDRDNYNALLDKLVRVNMKTQMSADASGAAVMRHAVSLWEK